MKYAFVNGPVAIVVRYWEEHGDAVDGGARVEVRRVERVVGEHDRPGAAGFAVRPVADGGLFRADLFMILSEPGQPCFHFHPQFEDGDVGERFFDDELTADPRGWIAAQLDDFAWLLERAGAGDLVAKVDLDEHRRAVPLILAAIDSCLARLPAVVARAAATASP